MKLDIRLDKTLGDDAPETAIDDIAEEQVPENAADAVLEERRQRVRDAIRKGWPDGAIQNMTDQFPN